MKREGREEREVNSESEKCEYVASIIVDAAIKVHRALGPGLLESAYQQCLVYELVERGLDVKCEVPVPVIYKDVHIEVGYRVDMIIENSVIIENKTVEHILPIHEAQLLTYLKLTGIQIGFLINWNVQLLKNGIKRFVINTPEPQWRQLKSS